LNLAAETDGFTLDEIPIPRAADNPCLDVGDFHPRPKNQPMPGRGVKAIIPVEIPHILRNPRRLENMVLFVANGGAA
jgi:hypothetical protein